MSRYRDRVEALRLAIDLMPVVSTHEHLRYEQDAVSGVAAGSWDVLGLFLVHYTRSDFVSAGATVNQLSTIGDTSLPFAERHAAFFNVARACVNTTQFRTLREGIGVLYGGDVLSFADALVMNEQMTRSHVEGVYDDVLGRRARIRRLVRDCGEDFREPQRFSYAVRFEDWLGVSNANQLRELEEKTGHAIHSLSSMIAALGQHAERLVRDGAVAFKSAMLYHRDPQVLPVSRYEAEQQFEHLGRIRQAEWIAPTPTWSPQFRGLQDYVLRELFSIAGRLGVPFQVHTGMPEGNRLPFIWGDPTRLLDLVLDFPWVDIHLLHMGHPFEREACIMAKCYPNVYLDASWVHQLNQSAAVHYLGYALDEVPQTKILGFGGDYAHHEGVFSSLRVAKTNIIEVLAKRVSAGKCAEDEAIECARLLLHDNASRCLLREAAC